MKYLLLFAVIILASPAYAESNRDDAALPLGQGYEHHAKVPNGVSKRQARYAPLVEREARLHGVPARLAIIVVTIESGWNPRARSRANARGLMQIIPATARRVGFQGHIDALYQPETNVKWAMKELARCYSLAGRDWRKTGHCYNGGPKRTHAKRLPRETRRYGQTIVAMR